MILGFWASLTVMVVFEPPNNAAQVVG
jgi:hypothetical protein